MSSTPTRTPEVRLRDVREDDLETLFAMQAETGWTEMAGIARRDRDAFFAHRTETAGKPELIRRAIEADGELAGEALSFLLDDGRRVIGYGVLKRFWGRGVASAAVTLLLGEVAERPLWATVLPANGGSRRVLERNGFTVAEDAGPEREDVLYVLG